MQMVALINLVLRTSDFICNQTKVEEMTIRKIKVYATDKVSEQIEDLLFSMENSGKVFYQQKCVQNLFFL